MPSGSLARARRRKRLRLSLGRATAAGLISELKPLIAKAIDAGIWYNSEAIRSFLEATAHLKGVLCDLAA